MVTIGEYERITKRSPASATSGASRRSRAKPRLPGASSAPSSSRARAMISLVPACRRTRSRLLSGRVASWRISRTTSASVVAESVPAMPMTSPRSTAARSRPWRFTAVRWPATERSTAWPCAWSPRIFATSPRGKTSTRSSTPSAPAASVPVTTVPKPLIVNTRSMGSRGSCSVPRAGTVAARRRNVARSSSSPAPVLADTGTTGAPSRNVPRTSVAPWSMWPAVPTTTWRRAALIGARGSWPRGGDDRLHEPRHLGRQHRPAVEEQPVLHEPADHRRIADAQRGVEGAGGGVRGAERDAGRRQLHRRQRAAAHLRAALVDARGEPLRRLRAEPAEHAPGARDHGGQRLGEEPERRDRLAGRAVLVRGERPLQRRDRKSTRLNSSHPSISYAVFCL